MQQLEESDSTEEKVGGQWRGDWIRWWKRGRKWWRAEFGRWYEEEGEKECEEDAKPLRDKKKILFLQQQRRWQKIVLQKNFKNAVNDINFLRN